jgi:hypothetical protein
VPRLALTRLARGLAVGMGYRQALVVLCPPVSVLSTAPQVSCDAMGWCERYPVSLRPDLNSNPDANPHLARGTQPQYVFDRMHRQCVTPRVWLRVWLRVDNNSMPPG